MREILLSGDIQCVHLHDGLLEIQEGDETHTYAVEAASACAPRQVVHRAPRASKSSETPQTETQTPKPETRAETSPAAETHPNEAGRRLNGRSHEQVAASAK